MKDFPVIPPILVKGEPDLRLQSIAEARAFVHDLLKQRGFDPWRDMLRRFDSVETEEEAFEAAGALRDLLNLEDLLTVEPRQVPPRE